MPRGYLLCWIVFSALAPSLAQAIIIHDEAANSSYYNVNASQAAFNGIGRVVVSGANVCSAFAINSFQVLTAAHCLPGVNPSFNGLALDGIRFSLFDSSVYAPTSVFVAPGFEFTNFQNGHDLAVLYYANGLPGVNTYPIFQYSNGEDELGDSFELFGYGRCGTPQGGWNVNGGACASPGLHRAANRYDHISANERLLQFSFDSYNPATQTVAGADCRVNDALCYFTGNENPTKQGVPEIASRQGLFAPGDSGGPSLIFREGQYYSVGLHSYVSCLSFQGLCLTPPDTDSSAGPNGTWGEFNTDTRLSYYSAFVAEAVPEPSTFALAAFAAAFLFWHSSRRRAMLDSSTSPAIPARVPLPARGKSPSPNHQTQEQSRR